MCGLVCILARNNQPVEVGDLQCMSETIIHRGPDDSGVFTDGSVGFAFRRLSILDLSPNGHQPMVSPDQNLVIVYNGEIYNYVELRKELSALGHQFQSSGDTEVLLHAYAEWGQDCLSKLNGMWAFLIYDRRRRVLFGSRDRFGIKPLYRYCTPDATLFGSEIKAIRASKHFQSERTNWSVAASYLLSGSADKTLQTFTAGVEQVRPGSAFEIDSQGNSREWTYWSLEKIPQTHYEAPDEAFRDIFEDSVRLRLRSDVPVGVCLSGGLDSTSILCSMARVGAETNPDNQQSLNAFSYQDPQFDESEYIRDTIKQTGATLHKLESGPGELWDRLSQTIWHLDEPVHSVVALIVYELMGLAASNGVRVVLNGQGADETCAGYPTYFSPYWQRILRSGNFLHAWNQMSAFAKGHERDAKQLFYRELNTFMRQILRRSNIYRKLSQRRRKGNPNLGHWYNSDFLDHYESPIGLGDACTLTKTLQNAVERDPLPLYLRVEDRLSMAHSVESRLPFLDYRLISLLGNTPDNWKLRGEWNKYILRQAMRDRIPDSVCNRVDKMGFPTTEQKWMAGVFYEPMQDILASQGMRERAIYNIDTIRNALEQHKKGQTNVSIELFRIAQFELWNESVRAPVRQTELLHTA